MNVCILFKYKVKITGSYSVLDVDDEFVNHSYCDKQIMTGRDILTLISKKFNDGDIWEVTFTDKCIHIGEFDPLSGESSYCDIEIEEIHE